AGAQAKPGGPIARKRHRFVVAAALVAVVAGLTAVAVFSRGWLFPKQDEQPEASTSKPKEGSPRPAVDPRVLTVSQNPKDGGQFRTITEALDSVEPGMTIRVLDDAGYEEHLLIRSPERHRGVVLEAVRNAVIHKPPGWREAVWIENVPDFTLRGFRFKSGTGRHALVKVTGSCPGVVLGQLEMTPNKDGDCVNLYKLQPPGGAAPIVVQNCTMWGGVYGIVLDVSAGGNHPGVIRNNLLVGCGEAVTLHGKVHRTQVVGNRIIDCGYCAINLKDFLPGSADILVANNTLLRNDLALRVWDDRAKGQDFLKCKNI